MPPKTKEIYASRPWPNPSETETRPTDITRGGDFHILIYMYIYSRVVVTRLQHVTKLHT